MSGISLDDSLSPGSTPSLSPDDTNPSLDPSSSAGSTASNDPLSSDSTSTVTNSRTVTETSEPSPSSSSSDSVEDSSTTSSTTTRSSTTRTESPSPSSTPSSSLTETTDISSMTASDESSETSSSKTDSSTTDKDKSTSTTSTESTSTSTTTTKHSSTSEEVPSVTASPAPKKSDDDGKLSTGTIIGISLAGFAVIGILLVVFGTFLKVRRKRIIEKQTAHLKRASAIWDFADTNAGNSDVDLANEKAARERGGTGSAPFAARRAHSRQESHDSEASADAASVHSHPPMAAANPYNHNMAPARPAPPPMLPYMHPMQRVVNRLSSIAFSGMARSAPAPPPVPPHDIEYGQHAQMRPPLGREDSFGARAHQAPPRNMFFPPPMPQQDVMPSTRPLAMPGSSI